MIRLLTDHRRRHLPERRRHRPPRRRPHARAVRRVGREPPLLQPGKPRQAHRYSTPSARRRGRLTNTRTSPRTDAPTPRPGTQPFDADVTLPPRRRRSRCGLAWRGGSRSSPRGRGDPAANGAATTTWYRAGRGWSAPTSHGLPRAAGADAPARRPTPLRTALRTGLRTIAPRRVRTARLVGLARPAFRGW